MKTRGREMRLELGGVAERPGWFDRSLPEFGNYVAVTVSMSNGRLLAASLFRHFAVVFWPHWPIFRQGAGFHQRTCHSRFVDVSKIR